jgi:hypothetical protein
MSAPDGPLLPWRDVRYLVANGLKADVPAEQRNRRITHLGRAPLTMEATYKAVTTIGKLFNEVLESL